MKQFIFGAFAVAFIFLRAHDPAFAQAGATGGVVGKQNKDASGGSDTAPPTRSEPSRRLREPDRQRNLAPTTSLSGRWTWQADCKGDPFRGEFTIRQSSATTFSGDTRQATNGATGKITDGVIDASRVSFTVILAGGGWGDRTESWSGSLGPGRRMEGSLTYRAGTCTWSADRG